MRTPVIATMCAPAHKRLVLGRDVAAVGSHLFGAREQQSRHFEPNARLVDATSIAL